MHDLDNGNAHVPGSRQQRQTRSDATGVKAENGAGGAVAQTGGGNHDEGKQGIQEQVREVLPQVLAETLHDEQEIQDLIVGQSWSGLLPDPESFSQYPKHVQDKMVEWNNAEILAESARSDRIVDATIRQAGRTQLFSAAINVTSILAAFICFLLTRDALSFGFLAVPGATVVFNIIVKVRGGKGGIDASVNEETPIE